MAANQNNSPYAVFLSTTPTAPFLQDDQPTRPCIKCDRPADSGADAYVTFACGDCAHTHCLGLTLDACARCAPPPPPAAVQRIPLENPRRLYPILVKLGLCENVRATRWDRLSAGERVDVNAQLQQDAARNALASDDAAFTPLWCVANNIDIDELFGVGLSAYELCHCFGFEWRDLIECGLGVEGLMRYQAHAPLEVLQESYGLAPPMLSDMCGDRETWALAQAACRRQGNDSLADVIGQFLGEK